MTKTFLVGVDGSEGCERATAYAAERARCEGAVLVLLHVVDWSPYEALTVQDLEERPVDRKKEIADANAKILQPLVEMLGGADLDDLEIVTDVRHGHAAQTLAEYAKESGATQVFTGRRGRSKIQELLFGSVASRLVQISSVPVTVVP